MIPGNCHERTKEMKEFQSIHAAQPGYRGNIVVHLGGGHMLIVTLWESESTAHLRGRRSNRIFSVCWYR